MKTRAKNKTFVLVISLLISAGSITACTGFEKEETTTTTETTLKSDSAYIMIQQFPKEDLSKEEAAGVIFIREEEKLARDVYTVLYEKWALMPFGNIKKSEQVHMSAVKTLIDRYELEDPVSEDIPGKFENRELQDLYNELVLKGSENEVEALKVGALIEEKDIFDIQKDINETFDNQDVLFVMENLKRGSGNHLRAFVRNLEARGINYEPLILDKETYESIINK